MKINIHPQCKATRPSVTTYWGNSINAGDIDIDTDVADVTITDAFRGPILVNGDTCISLFARDGAFEGWCWRGEPNHETPVPLGAVRFSVDPRGARQTNIELPPPRTTVTDPLGSDADLLAAVGTDAAKWTDAFVKLNPDADWATMVSWFANAIEAGRSAGMRPEEAEVEMGVGRRDHDRDFDEPWMPDLPGITLEDDFQAAIYQAIGTASVCWERPEGAGVFDTTKAKWVAEGLIGFLERFKAYRFGEAMLNHEGELNQR